jgi:ribosomal protein S18
MSDIKSGPNLDDVFDEKAIVDSSATASTTTSESSPRKKGKYKKRKPLLNLKCPLCETSVKVVTYKDVYQLKKFTSVRGKNYSSGKNLEFVVSIRGNCLRLLKGLVI